MPIFINDQPTHFSDDARKNYIQQTSVADIKEIRAIVNPSAQYTTESDTGVINIITKNEQDLGQTLNVGFQITTLEDYSPWLSYSYDKDKLSLSTNVTATFNNGSLHSDSYSYSFLDASHGDTLNVFNNHKIKEEESIELDLDFQLNYKIDQRNSFSFYLTGELTKYSWTSYDSTYRKEETEYQYITNSK